ncbi:MAG TPA: ATP-binding cassette domain-containing protein, partial [Abditibacteriaceae bacterium]|nr:ATP-binding cassette domain-containing protein [Abditibacteriaceae bacterium]
MKAVDLSANAGEIVGLLGENGAGKSTLLNIVSGVLRPSSGAMLWQGAPLELRSPRQAAALGIGVVHQHGKLVENFSAGENMALHATERAFRIDKKTWDKRVESRALSLGWTLDASRPVGELSVGERQRIEILKALFAHSAAEIEYSKGEYSKAENKAQDEARNGARLLLLDEPTANLTPGEANELFAVLRRLRGQGRAVVFVSHKLPEVMALCDRVIVLRRGQIVGERQVPKTSVDELAHLMIGETTWLKSSTRTTRREDAPVRLRIDHVSAGLLREVSLQIRAGEIVGIAGVDGNGQAELVELLSGLRPPQSGNFRCEPAPDELAPAANTQNTNAENIKAQKARSIAVIPPDRQRVGLIGSFDLAENMALHPALRASCRRRFGFNWKMARS